MSPVRDPGRRTKRGSVDAEKNSYLSLDREVAGGVITTGTDLCSSNLFVLTGSKQRTCIGVAATCIGRALGSVRYAVFYP